MTRLAPRKSLLVLGLLVTVLGCCAALALAAHRTAAPAVATRAVTTAYSQPVHLTGTGPQASAPGIEPAGICSVPGIGSIGSLFGFCSSGSADSGILGGLNSICSPSVPEPEPANGGIDSIVRPPASAGSQGRTLYENYGVAGQFWAAYGLQCSDMTSLIGNNVAGMVFDAAKATDRVTITVYQSAAGNGILSWLANVVNRLVTSLGNAIYFPYLAPVVLLGVMWLAWNGLIRKRASRTIEGTIWMVVACAAAIWLIGRPADFTGFGQSVSNGVTQVLNVAFSKLPSPGQPGCVPVGRGDPQSPGGGDYGFTQGNGMVAENANELWTVLVCKPWLDGEFGTTQYSTGKTGRTPVNAYGRQLLWAQAIAANENPTAALIQAKQDTYAGIASSIKQRDPAVYPLFQGNQWTSRLEIGFAALFAALIAGVLILLIAVTLIILKLGFLLLLIAGPFFLIIGTHPGFGRVVAVRWVEMIIGVLLKQVVVAVVLSVLLYAYSLIMGTSDAVLPWALKILMIALVTVAVFIYRKPFQHLFSSVGYSSERRERVERSREMFRVSTLSAAAAASGFAGARLGRWSRRDTGDAAALADSIAAAPGGLAADPELAAGRRGAGNDYGLDGAEADAEADGQPAGAGARGMAGGNGRAWAAAGVDHAARAAPPLHLPSRQGASGDDASAAPSGWARGGVPGTGAGRPESRAGDAPPRTVTPSGATIGAGSTRPVLPAASPRPAQPPQRQPAPSSSRPAPQPSPRPARQSPSPRPATGGSAPAPSPRASSRPAPDRASGRLLWQPGPLRPGGWSGGSGAASAPPPAAPRSSAPPPPAPRTAAAQSSASPYSSAAPGPPRPWPRPANGAPAHASQRGASSAGRVSQGTGWTGDGQPGRGQPGRGQPGHGQQGSARDGQDRPGTPLPFWLRPVRRKK